MSAAIAWPAVGQYRRDDSGRVLWIRELRVKDGLERHIIGRVITYAINGGEEHGREEDYSCSITTFVVMWKELAAR